MTDVPLRLTGTLSAPDTLSGAVQAPGTLTGALSFGTASQPLRPATTTTLGGIIVGEDLQITQEGILSIIKATAVSDSTRPITAAAVHTEIGNINALLATI